MFRGAFFFALAPFLCFFPGVLAASDCTQVSTGLIPLKDLGDNTYQGFRGGLYLNGLNAPPKEHHDAGLSLAMQVVPRDPSGQPSPHGDTVLLAIGMSNAFIGFSAFEKAVQNDADVNPRLVTVNGAQSSQTAEIIDDPDATYWDVLAQRLAAAGVTPAQVQVVWLKEANGNLTAPFPQHAQTLKSQLRTICQILRDTFPNLRLCYLASRTYGGYSTLALSPEPYAYEQAFAVQWLIADQIQGDPGLNYDPAAGPVEAPWLAWGTYNWADGENPRSDGLQWKCTDFLKDGVHPSVQGSVKVGAALLAFLKTDSSSKGWFLAEPPPTLAPQALAWPYGSANEPPGNATQLVASDLPQVPTYEEVFVHAWNAPPFAFGVLYGGTVQVPPSAVDFHGGSLLAVPEFAFAVHADVHGKAWLPLGQIPAASALAGLQVYFQIAVVDGAAATGIAISRGLALRFGS